MIIFSASRFFFMSSSWDPIFFQSGKCLVLIECFAIALFKISLYYGISMFFFSGRKSKGTYQYSRNRMKFIN